MPVSILHASSRIGQPSAVAALRTKVPDSVSPRWGGLRLPSCAQRGPRCSAPMQRRIRRVAAAVGVQLDVS